MEAEAIIIDLQSALRGLRRVENRVESQPKLCAVIKKTQAEIDAVLGEMKNAS